MALIADATQDEEMMDRAIFDLLNFETLDRIGELMHKCSKVMMQRIVFILHAAYLGRLTLSVSKKTSISHESNEEHHRSSQHQEREGEEMRE